MTHSHPERRDDHDRDAANYPLFRQSPCEELLRVVRGDLELEHAAAELADAADENGPEPVCPDTACPETLSVLIVGGSRVERDRLIARLAGRCAACRPAPTPEHARRALDEEAFDVAIILAEAVERGGLTLLRDLAGGEAVIAPVLFGDRWTAATRNAAHEAGAAAVLTPECTGTALIDELRLAVRADRDRRAAIALSAEEVAEQTNVLHRVLDALCDAMRAKDEHAADETPDGVTGAEEDTLTVDELEALWAPTPRPAWNPGAHPGADLDGRLRGELDIEVALRRVLEFALERVGPTNAAVFLPSTGGEYTLGAYVNYDRPKDSAEVMLDHLAGVVAPEFEDAEGVERVEDEHELIARLGGEAHWLNGSTLTALACREGDETLAVAVFFRDPLVGFSASDMALFEDVRRVFSRRLAQIARVHHRAAPLREGPAGFDFESFEPDEWKPECDDDGLSEDTGDWGMAA